MKKLLLIVIQVTLISVLCFSQETPFDYKTKSIDTHKRLDSVVNYEYTSGLDSLPIDKNEFFYDLKFWISLLQKSRECQFYGMCFVPRSDDNTESGLYRWRINLGRQLRQSACSHMRYT